MPPYLFIFPPKCTIIASLRIVAEFFYTFVDGTFTFFKGGKEIWTKELL